MVGRVGILAVFIAFAAWGQSLEKVFYVAHVETSVGVQEIVNVVRTIGDIKDISVDVPQRSITVKGTPQQLTLAGWLTAELDTPGTVARDLPIDDPRAPLAQVIFLRHMVSAQEMQELVNAIRSVVDIQRFFPVMQQKAIVMRGMPEQVKAADWLISALDQPASPPVAPESRDYRLAGPSWDARSGLAVRVAYLKNLDSPQAIQEIVNATRSLADMQRCFPITSRKALLLRATDDQVALATWLLRELDTPPGQAQGTREFKGGGSGDQMVHLTYVNPKSREALQESVNEIRAATKMQRVYPVQVIGAIAMRGTPDQLARANALLQSPKPN